MCFGFNNYISLDVPLSHSNNAVKYDVYLDILLVGIHLCNEILIFQGNLKILIILQTLSSMLRHRYEKQFKSMLKQWPVKSLLVRIKPVAQLQINQTFGENPNPAAGQL